MIVKFPQLPITGPDNSFIVLGNTPYAKHNVITKTHGKQIGFLTEHAVMFIRQGKKYFHFTDHTVCVNSNELILVKRGIYTISEFIPDNGCFEALIIFIPDKFFQSLSRQQSSCSLSPLDNGYTITTCTDFLKQFQTQYLNYFIGNFQGKQQLLDIKLQELFVLLQQTGAAKKVDHFIASCLNKESVDIAYIVKSNLFQPLSVEDYARLCMRSLASFKRDFKKQFNSSPKQWINHQRILHASTLLNSTNKTIAEIAFESGFENSSHFIRLFKAQTGFTPKTVRAKSIIK